MLKRAVKVHALPPANALVVWDPVTRLARTAGPHLKESDSEISSSKGLLT